jgi:hypothetical protein
MQLSSWTQVCCVWCVSLGCVYADRNAPHASPWAGSTANVHLIFVDRAIAACRGRREGGSPGGPYSAWGVSPRMCCRGKVPLVFMHHSVQEPRSGIPHGHLRALSGGPLPSRFAEPLRRVLRAPLHLRHRLAALQVNVRILHCPTLPRRRRDRRRSGRTRLLLSRLTASLRSSHGTRSASARPARGG